jgi:hypothetical protein
MRCRSLSIGGALKSPWVSSGWSIRATIAGALPEYRNAIGRPLPDNVIRNVAEQQIALMIPDWPFRKHEASGDFFKLCGRGNEGVQIWIEPEDYNTGFSLLGRQQAG